MKDYARSLQASHKVRVTLSREGDDADTVVLLGTEAACHTVKELLMVCGRGEAAAANRLTCASAARRTHQ